YTFRFTEGGETLEAECRTFTDRDKVTHFGLESIEETARLRCACQGADRTATLDLRLTGRKPSGSVVLAGQTFEMTSVTTANTSFAPAEPVGFRVDGADGPLGAVEVLHPGRVWLSKKLDPASAATSPASWPACCFMSRSDSDHFDAEAHPRMPTVPEQSGCPRFWPPPASTAPASAPHPPAAGRSHHRRERP